MIRIALILVFLPIPPGCKTPVLSEAPHFSAWTECAAELQQKRVYAGQPVPEFLSRCNPMTVTRPGHLTLYHFSEVRGFAGLTVIAKGGYLVRAVEWTDFAPATPYFDTMTRADEQLIRQYAPSLRIELGNRSPQSND